jgi:GWxTD domain-containing protein
MKYVLAIGLFFSINLSLWAIDASISYATFRSPDQPYIEVYLHIAGSSIRYVPATDSTYKASVEVVMLFKQGEKVVKFDKFALNSPEVKRTIDFIDLKRFGLDNGEYTLVVAVRDLNKEGNAKEYNTEVVIDYPEGELAQSDLELLSRYSRVDGEIDDNQSLFVKNGLLMEPLPYNFYSRHASNLYFYNEVYGADQAIGEDFVVSYAIEKLENDQADKMMLAYKRLKAAPIVPVLQSIDISDLRSGNYRLIVELLNRERELLSRKSIFFQRSNPYLDKEPIRMDSFDISQEFVQQLDAEEVEYGLRALTPKMPQPDVDFVDGLIKKDSLRLQRLYLFNYWVSVNANNPKGEYEKYMEVARAVDQLYDSGFRHGFETDRGYIYLKYGQPDDTELRDQEPSAPPYEIWTYYEFPRTNQNNVKFVFYNPSLAPGDFVLLHSNAIGELQNPQWLRELYRNAPNDIEGDDFFGGQGVQDNFMRNAQRVFDDY